MPDQSPNQVDERGHKIGMWTEADSHGGVMTGEYVEGDPHGVWRHHFADGSVRSEVSYDKGVVDGAWTWYRSTGGLLQRGDSSAARNTVCGNAGTPRGIRSTKEPGTTARRPASGCLTTPTAPSSGRRRTGQEHLADGINVIPSAHGFDLTDGCGTGTGTRRSRRGGRTVPPGSHPTSGP